MKTLKIEILMENAAFVDGNSGHEVARILSELEDSIRNDPPEDYETNCVLDTLYDSNGNEVGLLTVVDI